MSEPLWKGKLTVPNLIGEIEDSSGALIAVARHSKEGRSISACERAAEIKRLCNLHDELVEGLKEVLKDHDERIRFYPRHENQENRLRVMAIARALLAKAKEG